MPETRGDTLVDEKQKVTTTEFNPIQSYPTRSSWVRPGPARTGPDRLCVCCVLGVGVDVAACLVVLCHSPLKNNRSFCLAMSRLLCFFVFADSSIAKPKFFFCVFGVKYYCCTPLLSGRMTGVFEMTGDRCCFRGTIKSAVWRILVLLLSFLPRHVGGRLKTAVVVCGYDIMSELFFFCHGSFHSPVSMHNYPPPPPPALLICSMPRSPSGAPYLF